MRSTFVRTCRSRSRSRAAERDRAPLRPPAVLDLDPACERTARLAGERLHLVERAQMRVDLGEDRLRHVAGDPGEGERGPHVLALGRRRHGLELGRLLVDDRLVQMLGERLRLAVELGQERVLLVFGRLLEHVEGRRLLRRTRFDLDGLAAEEAADAADDALALPGDDGAVAELGADLRQELLERGAAIGTGHAVTTPVVSTRIPGTISLYETTGSCGKACSIK